MPTAPYARAVRRGIAATLVLWSVSARAGQVDTARAMASEALASCEAADAAPMAARPEILSGGLQRAEDAVEANPRDAIAHFAVFCNLGKRVHLEQHTRGVLGILRDVGRVRREIDATLALAPDHAPALAAKGQMLVELPRLLGGDPEEGERLLRRAVDLDPSDSRARHMLAKCRDGDRVTNGE